MARAWLRDEPRILYPPTGRPPVNLAPVAGGPQPANPGPAAWQALDEDITKGGLPYRPGGELVNLVTPESVEPHTVFTVLHRQLSGYNDLTGDPTFTWQPIMAKPAFRDDVARDWDRTSGVIKLSTIARFDDTGGAAITESDVVTDSDGYEWRITKVDQPPGGRLSLALERTEGQ